MTDNRRHWCCSKHGPDHCHCVNCACPTSKKGGKNTEIEDKHFALPAVATNVIAYTQGKLNKYQSHNVNAYRFSNDFHFLITHFIKYYQNSSTRGNVEMLKFQSYTATVFLKGLEERLALTSTEGRHQLV